MASLDDLITKAKNSRLAQAIGKLGPSQGQRQIATPFSSYGKTLQKNTAPLGTGAGYGLREAIYKPFGLADSQLYARQNQSNINAAQVAKTPQAKQRLYNAVPEQMRQDAGMAQSIRAEAPYSFAKTALTVVGAGKPAGMLAGMGMSGALTAGIAGLQGKDPGQAFGEGAAEAMPYAGINRITAPVWNSATRAITAPLQKKVLQGVMSPTTAGVGRRSINGLLMGGGNVAENFVSEPIFNGRMPTLEENLIAFGAGAGFGAAENPKIMARGKSRLKTQPTTTVKIKPGYSIATPDGKPIFGLSKQEAMDWTARLQEQGVQYKLGFNTKGGIVKVPGHIDLSAKIEPTTPVLDQKTATKLEVQQKTAQLKSVQQKTSLQGGVESVSASENIIAPVKIDRTQLTGKQLDIPNSKLLQSLPSETQLPKIKTAVSELNPLNPNALDYKQTQQSLAQQTPKAQLKVMAKQVAQPNATPLQKAQQVQLKAQQQVKSSQSLPSLEDSIRSSSLDVKNKVNAIDYLRTPDRVLKKIGLANEAEVIKTQYNKYLDELPKEIDKVTEWYKRVGANDEASRRIFKYLDGQPIKLEGEELRVATEMRGYLGNWADKLGLPEDKRIASYITHIFEKDFIQKEFDPDLAKLITDKVPGSVYDPFLQQRLGKQGYIEDAFKAMDAYVKRASRKFHMDPALEGLKKSSEKLDLDSFNYVKTYADRINLRPTSIDNLFDTLIKQSPVGYKLTARPVASISRGVRQMVYRGTLGLNVGSAIRNLTQGTNTYAQLGEKYTGIGYMKAVKSLVTQSDELAQSGVLRNSFIEDRGLSATKKFWESLDKGLFVFFEAAEKINRGAAYYGAKSKALSQGMSEEQAIKAGVDMARKTQFTFGSVDTPVAMQSDIGKLLTQFQSFNVKQTEFLTDMAKNKEYAGVLRWLGANVVVLATVGQAMGWDWKDMIPFGGLLDGQSPIGSSPPFTMAKDLASVATGGSDQYGQPMKPKQLLNDLVPFIPAGVQLKKTIGGLTDTTRGYAQTASGLVKYPIDQTAQNFVTAGTLGTSKLKVAQDYRANEQTQLGKNQSAVFKSKTQEERGGFYQKILVNRGKADGETATTSTLPQDKKSLDILYKDAESTIKSYASNKVKAEAGLVDKDITEYQSEVDAAIKLKKQIEQKYPEFRKDTTGVYSYEDATGAEKTIDISKVATMPSTSKVDKLKKKQETYSMVSTVMKSDLPDDKKQQAISELGVSKADADYYMIASEDNEIKIANAYDTLEKSGSFDDFMKYLVNGRRPVNGKLVVTDGVITDLVNEGVIPYAVGKELKEIDLYEDGTRNMGKIRAKSSKASAAAKKKDIAARMKALNQLYEDLKKINPVSSGTPGKINATKVNTKALTFSGR